MILFDIINKSYLDTEHLYVNPFTMTVLDIHRDGIYQVNFYQIILKSLSDNKFDYSQQKISPKEFVLTFVFNYYDVTFLLNQEKVLETTGLPIIIQKI